MSYTLVWAATDELGCIRLNDAPVPDLDRLVDVLMEHGVFACDALVFQGEPIFDRWDRDLNDRFGKAYAAMLEEGERREYERLKAKFDPPPQPIDEETVEARYRARMKRAVDKSIAERRKDFRLDE